MKAHMLVLTVLFLVPPVVARGDDVATRAASSITIEAKDLDAGNVRVSLTGQAYADGPSCIWHGSGSPDRVEYVIEFPITADYTLSSLYTAQDSRPVAIRLDGKAVHNGLASVTGSWQTTSARWERQCTLHVERGRHTLSLEREGPLPHVCAPAAGIVPAIPRGLDPEAAQPRTARRAGPSRRAPGEGPGAGRGHSSCRPRGRAAGD